MKKWIVPTLAVAVLGGGFSIASITTSAHAQTTTKTPVVQKASTSAAENEGSETSTGKDTGANVEQTDNSGQADAAEKAGSETSTGKDTGANVEQTGNSGQADAVEKADTEASGEKASSETSTSEDTGPNVQQTGEHNN